MASKTFGHAALLADLHQFTHHQNQRERLRKAMRPVVILAPRNSFKTLRKAIESYTGTPIRHRARPTQETRQASADELRAKMTQLLDLAAEKFKNGELTGLQLSEFEARINHAIAGLAGKT